MKNFRGFSKRQGNISLSLSIRNEDILGIALSPLTSARNYSRTTYPDSYWILNDRLLSDIYDETYPVED